MAEDSIIITVPADTDPETLRAILDAAGNTAVTTLAEAPPEGVGAVAAALDAAGASLAALPDAWATWSETLAAETGHGFGWVLLISIVVLAIAYVAECGAAAFLRADKGDPVGHEFSSRIRAAFFFFSRRLGGLAIFAIVAILLSRLFLPDGDARAILEILLAVILLQRFLYVLFLAMAAPHEPQRRLLSLDDGAVTKLRKATIAMLAATALLRAAAGVAEVAAPLESGGLQAAAALAWLILIVVFALHIREEGSQMVTSRWGENRIFGYSVERLAPFWPYPVLLLAALLAVQTAANVLLAHRGAALGWTFQVVVLTPFALGMVSALRAEKVAAAEGRERMRRQVLFTLGEGAVFLGAVVLILIGWGIRPMAEEGASGAEALGAGFVTALVAAILGWVGLRAVREAIAFLEPQSSEEEDGDGDELGKEGSRLGTILPVLRGFLIAVVIAVAAMVALSALGVNIGPMIAGAGIFGLAIGFGSQKLVADVISGMFFLYEDAFRVGEYIETDEGKGVVERISVRSARLRHHRGSVVTVPFGSMGTVRNHSRDWVKVKFTFDVPDKTDLEKVRKTVKKIGVELSEDPLLKDKFIEPLKSQGAVAINGSAYTIGVKYTCKPGDQFVIRRRAFAMLQKGLSEHGIELHTPSITLDQMGRTGKPARTE